MLDARVGIEYPTRARWTSKTVAGYPAGTLVQDRRQPMSTQDTMAGVDIESIMAMIPADYRAAGRQYLAAIAEATSDEERARLRQATIDATLRVARENRWCGQAEAALQAAFGNPPEGGWRASDGVGRDGYTADGYTAEGYDRSGYDRDGYDPSGHNRDGFNRDGFNRSGYAVDGFNVDGFDANGYNREGLNVDGLTKYRFDLEGFDSDGYDRHGWNRGGFGRDGFNRAGVNAEGTDREGRTRFRFDPHGFDVEGYDRNGQDYDGRSRASNVDNGRPPRVPEGHPRYAEWLTWYESRR